MKASLLLQRRALFLWMALAVALPFAVPLPIPSGPREAESDRFFELLDRLPPGRPILISLDYSPDSAPEVEPVAVAAMGHCRRRGVPVVCFTAVEDNRGQAEELVERLRAPPIGARYGEELVFLGFRPEIRPLIFSMVEEIRQNFPVDAWGTPLDEIPLTRSVHRLADFSLVLSVAADDLCMDWIVFGANRFHVPLAMGVSANLFATIKPFAQSGDVRALLRGMKGAAEYEQRLVEEGILPSTADATRGMASQSCAHWLLIALILLGNAEAFLQRGRSP